MADKKEVKKSKKSSEKEEKVSLEEIKKKREEVLARIDAEIGVEKPDKSDEAPESPEEPEEAVVDEDADNKDISDAHRDEKEEFEKKMLDDNRSESDSEPVEDEKPEEEVSIKEEVEIVDVSDAREDEAQGEEKKELPQDDYASPFSAKEFGLADNKGNKGKNVILFIVVFLLVAIISGLFYLFTTGALRFEPAEEQDIVPTEAPTATPTPIEFNRADLSVQVLNGSGVSGAAAEMQTFLEGLGYEDIEIGNADSSDYENITIQITEEFEEYIDLIIEDAEEDYTVNSNYELLEDSNYDVVIIIGSQEPDDGEEVEVEESDE